MSSSRTILSRPRTRIYDSNYNIGESYYKGALDRLDRKYSGRPTSPPRQPASTFASEIADRHSRIFADEDLETSRRRAEKHITEPHLFDSRGGRIGGARAAAMEMFDGDVDAETATALKRIRAQKKISIIDDVDLESTTNNISTHRLLDRSEKILNSVGISEASRKALDEDVSSAYKRRALKMTTADDKDATELTKWTAIEDSPAALRAKQSRARIDDIDEEMAALAEKQAIRERRVARLKALVAETESETVSDAGEVQSLSVSARKEKKSVRF